MDTRSLLVFLGVGLVAGFLASFIVGGGGLIRYLITGVVGAFVGGYLFSVLGISIGGSALLSQIITATAGAIVVVLLARLIA
ncbi:MAG: GlsB/YeaQ/YmgE family stress response membrane protein [Rhizobiaceae bacterium]